MWVWHNRQRARTKKGHFARCSTNWHLWYLEWVWENPTLARLHCSVRLLLSYIQISTFKYFTKIEWISICTSAQPNESEGLLPDVSRKETMENKDNSSWMRLQHTRELASYANAVSLMTVWQGRVWVTDGTMLGGGGGRSCAWATSYIDCSYTKDSPVTSQFECKLSNVSMHVFYIEIFYQLLAQAHPRMSSIWL